MRRVVLLALLWAGSVLAEPYQDAAYIGTQACSACHSEQAQHWQNSDHDWAMRPADETSVLGDFADVRLTHNGQEHRLYRKGAAYWVRLADAEGQLIDLQIQYTFGYDPLQQYLVKLPDGRMQLIPWAWDARPKAQGGQRWFHLYPELTPQDEFFWTNAGQNWNFMCADCHVTGFRKGFDSASNRYQSQWLEHNVGCEACHGPGKAHAAWAAQPEDKRAANNGLARQLQKPVQQWLTELNGKPLDTLQPGEKQASDQLTVCAKCHSRRLQMREGEQPDSLPYQHAYLTNLIDGLRYYPDGQVNDENYVYGSFLQSVMHEKGVVCSNCHEPHSTQLRLPEPQVCQQCHVAPRYNSPEHHHHKPDSPGAQCSNCHMPQTTYMQVDPRRDHSMRVPRPDLTRVIGTPNACNQCHTEQTPEWAEQHWAKWFPTSAYRQRKDFAAVFAAADVQHPRAGDALSYIAQDINQPDILRASALQRLAPYQSNNSVVAIARAVSKGSELQKLGAIEGAAGYPAADRWRLLSALLSDANPIVRGQAAASLVADYQNLTPEQQARLKPALADYEASQQYSADRAFALTNLANVQRHKGREDKAVALYLQAIEREPIYPQAYINLADLYRAQSKDAAALKVLDQGRKAQPHAPDIAFQRSMAMVRLGQKSAALKELRAAIDLAPEQPHYHYVLGVMLEASDASQSYAQLHKAFALSGNPQHLYAACEIALRNKLGTAAACVTELTQHAPAEAVQQLRQAYP